MVMTKKSKKVVYNHARMCDNMFLINERDVMELAMIKEGFEERGLQLTIDAERPVAKCVRFTKRARNGFKVEFNYRFGTRERMAEFLTNFLVGLAETDKRKEERKIARAAAKVAALETVKEGDLFVASWGWEQTNIDAYQVVAKKGATVTLREIAVASVEGSEAFMSDRVVPLKDRFIGEEFKKRITGRSINIDDVRYASPAEEGKEFYRSWYA